MRERFASGDGKQIYKAGKPSGESIISSIARFNSELLNY